MSREKWLSKRVIGSSDAPAIMGVSKWDTPYQLWEKKMLKKETPDNYAMQYGREMEPIAREWVEKQVGIELFPAESMVHPKHNFMTANIDGMDLDRKIYVEIKNPGLEEHETVKRTRKVPAHYYPQVQHGLEVVSLNVGLYVSFYRGDGVIVEVEKNNPYVSDLVKAEEDFYKCMIEGTPPELCDRDYANYEENPEWLALVEEWKTTQNNFAFYEEKKEMLREKFLSLCTNKSARGGGMKVTKYLARGNVDYKKIPELNGIDLEPYRKSSYTKWTLTCA
jgi:putative phage-type endonuclease